MTELLCISKNGKHVYYDSINSHASTHFADTPQLRELVIEVLQTRILSNVNLEFDIDTGKVIGTCDVVETDNSDEIVYAFRKNRSEQGYVPFTKSRYAQPDSYLSVSLIANLDGTYQLSSAWIGKLNHPPFPQQPDAIAESKSYWSKHAFVWGSQQIEPNSEINNCPW
jgi:hypothetical protein